MNVNIGLMMFATSNTIPITKLAYEAEQLGFESLFLPEHPVIPVDSQTPFPGGGNELPVEYRQMLDPLVGLAAAAGATKKIKLGTAISLVLERNPILAAKSVASLDQVSNGRFVFGIGSGWLKEEGDIFNVDWPRRGAQMKDFMLAMKACWTKEVSSYNGSHVQFPELICNPKPVQKPHPPILIAGELNVAVKRAAEWGDGWIPRYIMSTPEQIAAGRQRMEDLYRQRDRDPANIDITLFGGRTNRDEMQHWVDAGVTRILYVLPAKDEPDTLSRINHIASKVL